MATDQLSDLALGKLVDDVARRESLARIHAHIEGRVVGVREAAAMGVELNRGEAEIEVDEVHVNALIGQCNEGVRIVGADEARGAAHLARKVLEALLGSGVAVDRDQLAAGRDPLGDQAGVPAAAEGAVDGHLTRGRVEKGNQLGA